MMKKWNGLSLISMALALLPAAVVLFFDRATLTVFEPDKLRLFQTGVVVLTTAYIANSLWKGDLHLKHWPLFSPVLGLNGVFLVAVIGSLSPHWSFWGSYERAQGVFCWLSLSLFAYLLYQFRKYEGFDDLLLWGLVGSSVLVVVYALLQAGGLDPWQWQVEEGTTPVFGTLGRSNYLAAYLVVIMPITIRELACPSQRWQRIGLGLLITAQGLTLLLTNSRIGWLTLGTVTVVGLVGWGVLRRVPKWWVTGCVLGAVSLGLLVLLNLSKLPEPLSQILIVNRLSTLRTLDAGSIAARLTIWKALPSLIGKRPLLGYGPGTFTLAFARVYPPELVYFQGRETMVDHAHNLWLNLVVESGILGVLAMLTLSIAVWWHGLRHLRCIEQPLMQFQHFTLLMALLACTLVDLTQPSTAATLIATWALYSLVLPHPTIEGKKAYTGRKRRSQRRVVAVIIAIVGGLICLGLCIRPALADHQLAHGLRLGDISAIATAQGLMPRRDAYFHQGGRFLADLQTEASFASAEAQFLCAVDLCPVHPLYWADLGTMYLAWSSYDVSRLDQAEFTFQKALAINGNQALWLRGLGRVYFLGGEWREAEDVLRKAVSLDATDAQAHLLLGDLYYRQERFSDALVAYQNAHTWWPGSALPLAGLGRSYHQLGQCQEAIPLLLRSVRIEPTGPLTYQALADCYLKQERDVEASAVLKEGLSLYPQAEILVEMAEEE